MLANHHQYTIYEKAMEELFRLLGYCFDHPEYIKEYRNQAFGVAQFVANLCPDYEKATKEMWENWQISVDNLLQMCYNKVSN
jgi:hypothetical protein